MSAKSKLLVFSVLAALLLVGYGCASAPKAPEATAEDTSWMFHTIVDTAFVQQYAKVPVPADTMIIDSRPKRAKYDKGYIPSAISMPDSKFEELKGNLPENKDALLIFYCGGLKCKLSHKSAKKAEALGYTNVKVFAEGFPKWKSTPGNYYAVELVAVKTLMEAEAPLMVIDSRPKRAKYDKGHIPGAVSIPDSKFDEFKGLLPQDKSIPLIFYCGGYTCKLSHSSAAKALALGYNKTIVFAAGYPSWKKEMGAGMAAVPVKAGAEEGSIEIATFEKIIKESPDSIMLVDVRDPDEFAAGHFKSSVNMPTDELEAKVNTLPSDKPIVFVCSTGARSGEAYYMLQDLRPELKEVYYLEAEITFEKDGGYTIKKPVS